MLAPLSSSQRYEENAAAHWQTALLSKLAKLLSLGFIKRRCWQHNIAKT
jgi:hypothetical protein